MIVSMIFKTILRYLTAFLQVNQISIIIMWCRYLFRVVE